MEVPLSFSHCHVDGINFSSYRILMHIKIESPARRRGNSYLGIDSLSAIYKIEAGDKFTTDVDIEYTLVYTTTTYSGVPKNI